MEEMCMCPMWEPKKREEWEKWMKGLREKVKGMGCMCPMWELKEEKKPEEERGDTRGVSGAGSPEAHQRSAESGAKVSRRRDG